MEIVENTLDQYLRDESRSIGSAENIVFPHSEEDIVVALRKARERNSHVTVQGARTGLTAGAVPFGGDVISLIRMNRITGLRYDDKSGTFLMKAEPGVLLSQVRKALETLDFDTSCWSEESLQALRLMRRCGKYVFPPDPTETSASLGGMVACNASGARSFFYGSTRNHIEGLRVVLADGSVCALKRGRDLVVDGCFSVDCSNGKVLSGKIPHYSMPEVKNASGYYVKPNMDLIDLFVGAEGTLGVVTEIELRLLPAPKAVWGLTAFFSCEEHGLEFVQAVRSSVPKPTAVEYFNSAALNMLRASSTGNWPELKQHYHTAIYVEYHGKEHAEMREAALKCGQLIETCGGTEPDTWVASNVRDLERLHQFRHATPECVNALIDQIRRSEPRLTKLGTDMAVPDRYLKEIVEIYNSTLAREGLEAVMFGHIGNNHIHVNILPRNLDDYLHGKELYLRWAREVVRRGGTVSAEHGIGKLKTMYLVEMYGYKTMAKMKAIKSLFDPTWLLNPGNMLESR